MKYLILAVCLMMAGFLQCKADVATPGQIDLSFMLENSAEFEDYQFYYLYQRYTYHEGYQPSGKDTVMITDEKVYDGGSRYNKTVIRAFLKSDPSQVFESEITVGGEAFAPSERIQRKVEVYKVKSIEEGKIILKKTKTLKEIRTNEGTKLVKWSSVQGFDTWMYLAGGGIGLVLLGGIFFFVRRKRA